MPGLILFGRRWAIASDDFVYPSFGEGLTRIAWEIVLIVILSAHQSGFECLHGHDLKSFYIGATVLNGIEIIIVIILLRISMQGTIKNPWPRRNIQRVLYTKIFMYVSEAVWLCISTYWAFGHDYTCSRSVYWTARAAVICSWIIGFFTFIAIAVAFDPMGSLKKRNLTSLEDGGREVYDVTISPSEVWEKRCRLLCCCVAHREDMGAAFAEIGKIVADFFKDLDLVPTDIAAGLILVQEKQVHSDGQLRVVVTSNDASEIQSTSSQLEPSLPQPKSWMTIFNMAHYMKYAMGSYGWPFYMYEHFFTGLCGLCFHCSRGNVYRNDLLEFFRTMKFFSPFRCCSCLRKSNNVFKDNICQCNSAAIKKLSGLKQNDLVYVTFKNQFKQVPFYVALDREKNTVVVSIRGTLSLQDAVTDLSAKGADLDIPGVRDSYCHAAMLDCANYIKSQLESLNLLETAFSKLHDGAGLVITGHSLGAGVAAILAVLLRPKYPHLMCFSFSPPGGLMSTNASKFTQDFVCSVVVGKDLVPRLGMYTLVDLKVKILKALCETNKPKYRILASGCWRLVCCIGPSQETSGRHLQPTQSQSKYSEERSSLLQEALRDAELQLEEVKKTQWPLHPAGQILHVLEMNDASLPCSGDPQYFAVWSEAQCFDKIVISNKMVFDHFPNTVSHALDQLAGRNYIPQTYDATTA
ncbi:diacylglycerol lipase-beta-like isoform X2 [Biomphalaria glabrata]|uniref:sn-1-specific diacylglycerol lipase n=1 Tax=Biomphalaria glabrata TaxID=6526 RepID=A0A9W2ZIV3_BIOGL|nr:diacylglycerol lipase-beta-like isoform X2 [Biomphalaria glabrata]